MQLVLHGRNEALSCCGVPVVVNSRSIDVGDLLVEFSFTETDLSDTLKLLCEILLGLDGAARPQALDVLTNGSCIIQDNVSCCTQVVVVLSRFTSATAP